MEFHSLIYNLNKDNLKKINKNISKFFKIYLIKFILTIFSILLYKLLSYLMNK